MTLKQAIKILELHQEWRMGANFAMLEPSNISEAINIILKQIKKQVNEIPKTKKHNSNG